MNRNQIFTRWTADDEMLYVPFSFALQKVYTFTSRQNRTVCLWEENGCFFKLEYSCKKGIDNSLTEFLTKEGYDRYLFEYHLSKFCALHKKIYVRLDHCVLFDGSCYAEQIKESLMNPMPIETYQDIKIPLNVDKILSGRYYDLSGKLILEENLWHEDGRLYHAGVLEKNPFFEELTEEAYDDALADWSIRAFQYGERKLILLSLVEKSWQTHFQINRYEVAVSPNSKYAKFL